MHYDACDMTIPTHVLEHAMSLHDSYSKAYMLPFRAKHTTPCGWALLYTILGVLTICGFHLPSPMSDKPALRTFLYSEAEGAEGVAHPWTLSPLLAWITALVSPHPGKR